MQVVYFANSLGSGGAQRQIVELAVSLRQRHGIDTRIYVYFDDNFFAERLEAAEVPVVLIPKLHSFDPVFALRLRQQILRDRPDVFHGFMWASCRWLIPSIGTIPRAKRPVFIAAERNDEVAKTRWMGLWQKLIYGLADLTTANAEPVIGELEAKLGIPGSKLAYIPNGIDLAAWDAGLRQPSPLTLDPAKFHVALVGRIERQKNHPYLLRALSLLDESIRSRMKVWFIGRNPGDGYPAEVEAEIRERGLSQVVELVGPQSQIGSVMAAVDVVILPSSFEGFPNVILEAMASRTAVLATDVGDNTNLIAEGECGYIVPVDDDAALAERLRRLCAMSPEERAAMGQRGRAIVEERYEMDRIADAHLDLYRSVLASAAGRGRPELGPKAGT